jgi:hypothetical protein
MERRNDLKHYKNTVKSVAKSTANLDEEDIITITAFYRREQKDSTETIIIYREEDKAPYYAPEYVKTVINNSSNIKEFIDYGDNVYGLDGFNPIIAIKQNGINSNGSKRWKLYGKINEKLKIPVIEEKLKEQKTH